MIYPIVAFGDPVLKKVGKEIVEGDFDVKKLAEDMFETMYNAHGVGLAAPQIGKSIRMFIIDTEPMDDEEGQGIKRVFINPEIVEEYGDDWAFEEGCLSIPNIREDVFRAEDLKLRWLDEDFNEHEEIFEGMKARVIQHEFDHIDGVLFTDHISALKRRLLKKKLINISKGNINVGYRMKFPSK